MRYVIDLHIHSRFARACSKSLNPENLAYWAQINGVDVLGTGDFTHPSWMKELEERLESAEHGLFRLKHGFEPSERRIMEIPSIDIFKTRFLLQTEISCIYKKGNKTRRLHILLLVPSFEVAKKINKALTLRGCKLASDGRPIIGMDVKELTKIALDADSQCLIVPAHAWTPWFAVFGSKSGFDSLQECFDDMTPYIYAIETGLSSDPSMNHHVSALDSITLLSNSDAHSCSNIAREANVMDIPELSYTSIYNTIKNNDREKFLYTIEFYPEEGMYHWDGHRLCKYSCEPKETIRNKGQCPVCRRQLTVGVLSRVEELSDRTNGLLPQGVIPQKSIVGLDDILAEAFGIKGRKSKKVLDEYRLLIGRVGSELKILLEVEPDFLSQFTSPRVVEGIQRNRDGRLTIQPGFDGQYGTVKVFSEEELIQNTQKAML